MLARTFGPKYSHYPAFVQPKLNGVRALYQRGVMLSRDSKIWNYPVLRHIIDELETFKELIGVRILDGELYVHGWRLQRINGAVATNRMAPREDTHLVQFHIFDCIDARGLTTPFSDRFLDFKEVIEAHNLTHVKLVDTHLAFGRDSVDQYFTKYVKEGYEGIMLRPDGPYEAGRTDHDTDKRSAYLWKHKAWKDGEFLCVGYVPGEGKADIGIGSLTLSTDANVVFQCGTGFTDEDRIALANDLPIERMVRVRYVELTSDGIPYPCRFEAVL